MTDQAESKQNSTWVRAGLARVLSRLYVGDRSPLFQKTWQLVLQDRVSTPESGEKLRRWKEFRQAAGYARG